MTRPLRIGIDARELLGATTGVGRYLGELLIRWMARPDRQSRRLVLYAPDAVPLQTEPRLMDLRIIGSGRGTWWEQTYLRRAVAQDRPDVFFAPAYTAPLGTPVPLAVTIHDISFVAHPEWFRMREGIRRRWLTRRAAQRAGVIFTDSGFSRAEITTRLRIDPDRIRVIPPGVTVRKTSSAAAVREPIVLFVGSLFNRRRLPDLIEAFAAATPDMPESRLVIVGDDRTWPRQDLPALARARGVAARTEFRRYLPDPELSGLYARASVFVFLSEYEGFGLTPLEALAAGVPAIVLDTPVAREVYKDAVQYVGPGDIGGTADAIRSLLRNPDLATPLLARAPHVLGLYAWDTAADLTLAGIESLVPR